MLQSAVPQGCRRTSICGRRRSTTKVKGMYVPSDSFGGLSPEKKASQALEKLFTFISAKVILAQLEGSGRGALAAYNQEQYTTLFGHLQDVPLSDPDRWLEQLMHKDKALALRLMEVRAAYCKEDFEWDQLQRLSVEGIKRSNLQLMRKAATASLQATELVTAQRTGEASTQQQASLTTSSVSSSPDVIATKDTLHNSCDSTQQPILQEEAETDSQLETPDTDQSEQQ